MDVDKQSSLDLKIGKYLTDYIQRNRAARVLSQGLRVVGVGLRPLISHIVFRSLDIDQRAIEFLNEGFEYDKDLGLIRYPCWKSKVYRKAGYPAIVIDQACEDDHKSSSLIPEWVNIFSDQAVHHIAVFVDDLHEAIFYLEKQGVPFSEKVAGLRGSDLRMVFSTPEKVEGKAFNVLALLESHGHGQILSPQTEGLFQAIQEIYE